MTKSSILRAFSSSMRIPVGTRNFHLNVRSFCSIAIVSSLTVALRGIQFGGNQVFTEARRTNFTEAAIMPDQVVVEAALNAGGEVSNDCRIVPEGYESNIVYVPSSIPNPDNNPLLQMYNAPSNLFAPYADIKPEHVSPAMELILDSAKKDLVQLEEKLQALGDAVTFAQVTHSLELIGDRFQGGWGAVRGTLTSVKDSEALREEVKQWQPKMVEVSQLFTQSKALYNAQATVMKKHKSGVEVLSSNQVRALSMELKAAEYAGLALEGEKKEKYNKNQMELSELSRKFNANAKDSKDAFLLVITDPADIEGIPEDTLSQFAQNAVDKKVDENATKEKGPWAIKLDLSNYFAVLRYSTQRWLREKLTRAKNASSSSFERVQTKDMGPREEGPLVSETKDKDGNPVDRNNEPIVDRILELRSEQVKLLGLKTDEGKPITSWAEKSLSRKMAQDPSEALKVLEDMLAKAKPAAEKEMEDLLKFAKENGFAESELKQWDVSFYSEKMKKALYDYEATELKQYFSYEEVKKGLWKLAERVFQVSVVAVLEEERNALGVQTWHKDVDFYKIVDLKSRELISYFYLDSPEREHKNGGAWFSGITGMTDNKVFIENMEAKLRVPVGIIVCNTPPATSDMPSLMMHSDVETLAHEFGHSLQHMLTKESIAGCAGIDGIEWDAVEFPSQFMENWTWNRETVDDMAVHWKTGKKIDDQLWKNVVASKKFMEGNALLRQLRFGMTDIYIHSNKSENVGKSAFEMEQDIVKRTAILEPLENDRFLCGFGHIFAGGYSAGYYSYIWAEILSTDAWEAVEDAIRAKDEPEVRRLGMLFRETVLSLGGGVPPAEVFERFRGRKPQTEPFLRARGLLPEKSL